jgi:hypothetical protein
MVFSGSLLLRHLERVAPSKHILVDCCTVWRWFCCSQVFWMSFAAVAVKVQLLQPDYEARHNCY